MTTTAIAAPPRHLPKGVRVNKGTSKELQCYSSQEFTRLLKLDNTYTGCLRKTANLKLQIVELQTSIGTLTTVNKLIIKSNTGLHLQVDKWFGEWKKENKLRHEAENKPRIQSWIGWTIAGVSTSILAGFVVHDLTN